MSNKARPRRKAAALCRVLRGLAPARAIIRRFSPGFKTNESYVYARACREWNIGKVRKMREEAAAAGDGGRRLRVAGRVSREEDV